MATETDRYQLCLIRIRYGRDNRSLLDLLAKVLSNNLFFKSIDEKNVLTLMETRENCDKIVAMS